MALNGDWAGSWKCTSLESIRTHLLTHTHTFQECQRNKENLCMDLSTVKQTTVLMFQDSCQPVAFPIVTGVSDTDLSSIKRWIVSPEDVTLQQL